MAEIFSDVALFRRETQHLQVHSTVVLTNGCFDVLHRGHFETIRFAKRQGDILVVAVNTDDSIRKLKGPHRPINRLGDRMAMVAGIAGVDYVVPFGTAENPSVEPLVEQLQPDVLVKGGDYSLDGVVGAAVVQHYGGRVVIAPKVPDASTTATLAKLDGIQEVRMDTRSMADFPGAAVVGPEPRCPLIYKSAACGYTGPRYDCGHTIRDCQERGNLANWVLRVEGERNRSYEQSSPVGPHRPWRILLDLDGVPVDFFGGMARALGYDDAWLAKRLAECPGEYDPGKLFGIPTDLFSIFGPDWWESLPWMPDGRAILDTSIAAVGEENICICSSPTLETSSPMGKLRWIERNMPGWSRRYVFTPDKFLLANPRTILLDDDRRQIEAFEKAGGKAILVLRPWNAIGFEWSGFDAAGYIRSCLVDIMEGRNHEEHEGHEDVAHL